MHRALASEALPYWVTTPDQGMTSSCSSMSHGEAVAIKIAVAKAKAELSRIAGATVQSVQTLEQSTTNGNNVKSSFNESTRVSSEQYFTDIEVIAKSVVVLDGSEQVCVMVGHKDKFVKTKN